jgi:GntR family histidine utilization transcriptional repressor
VQVHFEDGVAIQFEDRYVNPASAPHYLDVDLTQTTATHYLLEHAPLTEASYSIEAALPTAVEAKALSISSSAPCLVMKRRTISGTQVASFARLVYPGVRYSFSGNFQL